MSNDLQLSVETPKTIRYEDILSLLKDLETLSKTTENSENSENNNNSNAQTTSNTTKNRSIKIYEGIKVNPKVLSFLKGKTMEIVGFPGSGKSTVGKLLKRFLEEFSIPVYLAEEHIEVEIFKKMLDSPKEYAFLYQYVMLKHRIELKEKLQRLSLNNPDLCIIIDGGLITDLSFAMYHVSKKNIGEKEWRIYEQKLRNNAHNLVIPDIILEISCNYDNLQKKLEIRHREEEIKKDGKCVYDREFYGEMSKIYEYIKLSETYKSMVSKHVSFENNIVVEKNSVYKMESKNLLLKNLLNCVNCFVLQKM